MGHANTRGYSNLLIKISLDDRLLYNIENIVIKIPRIVISNYETRQHQTGYNVLRYLLYPSVSSRAADRLKLYKTDLLIAYKIMNPGFLQIQQTWSITYNSNITLCNVFHEKVQLAQLSFTLRMNLYPAKEPLVITKLLGSSLQVDSKCLDLIASC